MPRWAYRVWAAGAVFLALAAAALAVRTFADVRSRPELYFNADFLTPVALYDDAVRDGYPVRGFQFSAANFAVPDVLLYAVVRAAVGRTPPAFLLWMASLFVLVSVGGVAAGRALVPPAARRFVVPAVLYVVAVYLAANAAQFFGGFARELLLPVSHTGALAAALVGVWMCAACVRSAAAGRRLGWATGLAALTAAVIFSDRLFGLYFTAPVLAALAAVRLGSRPDPAGPLPVTWQRVALVAAAVVAGTAIALAGLRAAHGPDDPLQGYWTGITWDGATSRLRLLLRMLSADAADGNVLILSAAAWYAWSAARGVGWAIRRAAGRARGPADPKAVYELFAAAMAVGTVAAFVLSRASVYLVDAAVWPDFSRYFIGPFGAALFGWPVAAATAAASDRPTVRWLGAGGLLAVAAGCVALAAGPRASTVDLRDVYPDDVRAIDDVCRRLDLRDGLGSYWAAKRVTTLSREGVRVRQVRPTEPGSQPGLAPHVWLSNPAWYWRPPVRDPRPVQYEFVLAMDEPDHRLEVRTADVVAAFGEPAARERADKYTVLVYNRPTDERVQRFHEWDATVTRLRYESERPTAVRFAGGGLGATTGRVGPGGAREAVEGRDAAGVVATGPYVRPPAAGRYTVTFRVTSSGAAVPNGVAAVLLSDTAAKVTRPLAVRDVPAGTDQDVTLTLDLPRLPANLVLEFSVVYTGRGRLVLHWVDLRSSP